jgi:hypothetical protein
MIFAEVSPRHRRIVEQMFGCLKPSTPGTVVNKRSFADDPAPAFRTMPIRRQKPLQKPGVFNNSGTPFFETIRR